MFIGHFAVGFAAKKFAPTVSLAVLFMAAQFVDLLWPTLLLLGVERVAISPGITAVTPLDFTYYPFTHSLVMSILWGFIVGGLVYAVSKNFRNAVVVLCCVVSHWVLDLIVHRPDLPLTLSNSNHVGLGLWNFPIATMVIEFAMLFGGAYVYWKTVKPVSTMRKYGLTALVLLLAIIHVANIFGPPPPSVSAIAWAGHLQWLFVVFAYFVDKNQRPNVKK
ncbi:MAG: hypothetical protein HQ472_00750 [Ignavibacteria bacterium]|nr:hypothetical protein [Ignavibacteria bacterium]